MKPFLIDGPMMETCDRRMAVLARMVRVLSETPGAIENIGDAKRVLRHAGFAALDVEILADEARMVAMQDVVAREMTDNST